MAVDLMFVLGELTIKDYNKLPSYLLSDIEFNLTKFNIYHEGGLGEGGGGGEFCPKAPCGVP